MTSLTDTFDTSQSLQSYLLACMTTLTAMLCIIILLVVYSTPKLHKVAYVLSVAVAIPDLLQSLGTTGIYWLNATDNGWTGSQARCDTQTFFTFAFTYLDAATVVWISIHRYQIIVSKRFWSLRMYIGRAIFNVTCSIIVGLYGILINTNPNKLQTSGIMCSVTFGDTSSAANLWPTVHLFIGIAVVLVSIAYCYIQIYRALAEASRAIKQSRNLSHAQRRQLQEIKTTVKLFCIVSIWVIQVLPLFIIVCGGLNGYTITPTMSSLIAFSLHSNALFNSIVFFIDYNTINALFGMFGIGQITNSPITPSTDDIDASVTRKPNTIVPNRSTPKVSYEAYTSHITESYSNQRLAVHIYHTPVSQAGIRIDKQIITRHTNLQNHMVPQLNLDHQHMTSNGITM